MGSTVITSSTTTSNEQNAQLFNAAAGANVNFSQNNSAVYTDYGAINGALASVNKSIESFEGLAGATVLGQRALTEYTLDKQSELVRQTLGAAQNMTEDTLQAGYNYFSGATKATSEAYETAGSLQKDALTTVQETKATAAGDNSKMFLILGGLAIAAIAGVMIFKRAA